MTSPTPTPAHQAFREKRAVEIASAPAFRGLVVGSREYGEMCAAAGMAVEHEVARLIEREILHRACAEVYAIDNPQVSKEHKNWANAAAQALAALLEGK